MTLIVFNPDGEFSERSRGMSKVLLSCRFRFIIPSLLTLGVVSCSGNSSGPNGDPPSHIVGDLSHTPEIRIVEVDSLGISGTAINIDIEKVRVIVWSDDQSMGLPIYDPWISVDSTGTWHWPANNVNQVIALLIDPDIYESHARFAYQMPLDSGVLAWDEYPHSSGGQ